MRKLSAALLLLAGAAAWAARDRGFSTASEAAWMEIVSQKKGTSAFYFEIAQDGSVLSSETSGAAATVRRGRIKPMYAKDFFREIKNSDVLNAQGGNDSKMVFYQGDMLRISAYISGELRRFEAPLNRFAEAFSHAMTEARKASAKLPADTALYAFLSAEPLTGGLLEEFLTRAGRDYRFKLIETYDLQKNARLFAAIKQPHRLIPLETEEDARAVTAFILEHGLYGMRDFFYIKTTRGPFRCQVRQVRAAAPRQRGG